MFGLTRCPRPAQRRGVACANPRHDGPAAAAIMSRRICATQAVSEFDENSKSALRVYMMVICPRP